MVHRSPRLLLAYFFFTIHPSTQSSSFECHLGVTSPLQLLPCLKSTFVFELKRQTAMKDESCPHSVVEPLVKVDLAQLPQHSM